MNALVTKAFTALARLPEAEQEAIAREVLARIESDTRWESLLNDPRSQAVFRELIAEVVAAEEAREVSDFDPSNRPSK